MRKEKIFFQGVAWKHFRRNKPAFLSLCIIILFAIIALLAPVIANEKPLFIEINHETYFPAFSFSNTMEITNEKTGKKEIVQVSQVDWKQVKSEKVINTLIPYSPGKNAPSHYYAAPSKEHWLGTTKTGADVLSGLIHGTRISLSIGIFAMIIASLIGILLGSVAGYFGDQRLLAARGSIWMAVAGIIPAFFYGFYVQSDNLSVMLKDPGIGSIVHVLFSIFIFLLILFIFYKAGKILNRFSFFSKKIFVHADSLVSRLIEIFISIPRLILIISVAAIAQPSLFNLVLIIGFTSWTEIARFIRAELLRTRNSGYLETARAMGLPDMRVILAHALPNALASATVAIVFGVASAILVESGLSFLGIGIPQDVVTWGSLLFSGKENFEAWWLVVFPGLAIFITVTAFNLLGDGMRDAMDVKGRK